MTTLFSSFDQALPDIQPQLVNPDEPEGVAHESGSNTRRSKPPASAFEIPVGFWHEKAEDLCLRDPNRRARLEQWHMPSNEAAQLIDSEQDVVNASTLHFTHPVNVALSLVHRDDSYLCEVNKSKSNITSEGTASRSRVDTMYFKGRPVNREHPGASNNTMAGLEFKSVNSLNAQFWRNRIVTTIEAHQGRLVAARQRDVEHEQQTKNVTTILRQATHYSVRFKTKFIALFDYRTLILLVMDQVIEEKGIPVGGDFTYMTVVSDSNQFRKAFLGFLLCAHLNKDGNDSWKVARDRSDILTKASTLGSMAARGGAARLNERPARAEAQKRTYTERDSQSGSSQGDMQVDAARRAVPTAAPDRRKPAGLVKSNSSLSSTSTSSRSSATSTGSGTTVSSAGSRGAPLKGHAAPAAAVHADPSVTKTATIAARPKIEASKADTKPVAPKTDPKVVSSKTVTKPAAPKTDPKVGASKTAKKPVATK